MSGSGKKCILLVEDEPITAALEAGQLGNEGYRVVKASSGEAAVALVEGDPEGIDLILMDIDLGRGMLGTDAARLILAKHDIPLLFLSSHIEREIVERTEEITNYGYVVKSSSFTVLDASIKMAFKLFEAQRRIDQQCMDIEAAYEEMQVANEELIQTVRELNLANAELESSRRGLLEGERALQESETRYKSLFQNMDLMFSLYEVVKGPEGEPRDYRFLAVNPAYEAGLGLTASSVIGRTLLEVFPRTEAMWLEIFRGVASTRVPAHKEDHSVEVDRWFDIVFYSPQPGQVAMLGKDITEKKRDERRIAGLLQEKDFLLREVHHRIKNNMNAALSYLSFKTESCEEPAAQAILRSAVAQLRGMGVLYDRLRVSSGAAEAPLIEFLPELVGEILDTFGLRGRIALRTELNGIALDERRLSALGLAVNELVTNSIKHAFPGVERPEISIRAERIEGRIRLAYADNGPGYPPCLEAGKGGGFGLFLVSNLARQLGGAAAAESGCGARLVLEFPA